MYITREWLDAHRTERGGWTRAQFEALGCRWPLEHGVQYLVGRPITEDQRAAFEAARTTYTPRTLKAARRRVKRAAPRLF